MNNQIAGADLRRLRIQVLDSYDKYLHTIKPVFLFCENGHENSSEICGLYDNFGLYYRCNKPGCDKVWIVCCQCDKQRVKITSVKALRAHHTNCHKPDKKRKQDADETKSDCGPTARSTDPDSPETAATSYDFFGNTDEDCDDQQYTNPLFVDNEDLASTPMQLMHNNGVFSSKFQVPFMDCCENTSLGFRSTRNERFFRYCQQRKGDSSLAEAGIEYLTTTCVLNTSNLQLDDLRKITQIPKHLQRLLIDSATLCFRAGAKDRQLLADILSQQHANGFGDGWASCIRRMNDKFNDLPIARNNNGSDYIKFVLAEEPNKSDRQLGSNVYSNCFPKSPEDIRAMYLKGNRSILANLPHPEVMTDIKDHAYVSIIDCIRDALAYSLCQVQVIDKFSVNETANMGWMFTPDDIDADAANAELFEAMIHNKLRISADIEMTDEGFSGLLTDTEQFATDIRGDCVGGGEFLGGEYLQKDSSDIGADESDDDAGYSIDSDNKSATVIDYEDDLSDTPDWENDEDGDEDKDVEQNKIPRGLGDNVGSQLNDNITRLLNPAPLGTEMVVDNLNADHPFLLDLKKHLDSDVGTQLNHSDEGVCIDHPCRSKRALEIWYNAVKNNPLANDGGVVVSYIKFWTDDCDTNSQSMSGRAQVWVKTMTIAATAKDGNVLENTYPVAIGLKGVSHDKIEMVHAAELQMLQSPNLPPFYCGGVNQMVNCHFETLVNLGDQPEKREMNGVARGNATWGARSFVSANHKALYFRLKACTKCIEMMVSQTREASPQFSSLPPCETCLNWDVLKPNTNQSLVKLPANYPYEGKPRKKNEPPLSVPGKVNRITIINGERFLRPFRVTYPGLALAYQEAHDGYCNFEWNNGNVIAFLTVEGADNKKIAVFFEYANRAKMLQDAASGYPPPNYAAILQHSAQFPELYGPMPLPSIYSRHGVSLRTHIEGIMHIIILGVLKRSVWQIRQAQALCECESDFRKTNGRHLAAVEKLKLSWLKLMEYKTKKLHGWNAINYLAFARVMLWFYQTYEEFNGKEAAVVELPPEEEQQKWTKKQNDYWLRLRRIPITKANATGQRARVAKYMQQTPVPQILPPPTVNGDEIEVLILSLINLIECIFQPTTISELTIGRTEYAIRIFLSNVDLLDSKLKKPLQVPQVISSYNFMCLVNIPEQMRTYGPIREHFEGKFQGEAFLTYVKRWHTQGIRKNWAKNLLTNVLRDGSFRKLTKQSTVVHSGDCSSLQLHAGNFRKYSSITEVTEILRERVRDKKLPLSVVILTPGNHEGGGSRMFAVVGSDYGVVELTIVQVEADAESESPDEITRMGLSYYTFDVRNADRTYAWRTVVADLPNPRLGYAVLLPLLRAEASLENCMFTVISDNWKRLDARSTLSDLVDK